MAVLLVVGFIAYAKSFFADFQFDDYKAIVENPLIKHLDLPLLWHQYTTRFLTNLTFALNYFLGGLHVFGWHLANNLIHVANAFWVYLLVFITFETPKLKARFSLQETYLIAFFSSLVFLLHPIQTQAVTYIVQRATLLCAFFYFGAVYFYARARLKNRTRDYLWAMAFSFLGILTKPVIITLPLIVVLYSIFFFGTSERTGKSRIFFFLFVFALSIFVPLVLLGQRLMGVAARSFEGISSTHYLLTQFNVIVTYIGLWLLPVNQNIDYDYKISQTLFEFPTMASFVALVLLLALALRLFKRERLLSFGIFWFFIALGPQSSIFVLQDVIFEHRVYLAFAGLSVITAVAIFYLIKNRNAYIVMMTCLAIALAALTFQRNNLWSNALRFMEDVVAKSPNKARPHNNLGFFYYKQGRWKEAEIEYKKAIRADSNYIIAYHNLAMVYHDEGKTKEAENIFSKLIEFYPDYEDPYVGLAAVKEQQGFDEEALELLKRATRLSPYYASAYVSLGNLYQKKKDFARARLALEKALWLNPDSAFAHYNLGNVHFYEKNFYDALINYQKAVVLHPCFSQAFNNTGNIYFYFGDYTNAVEQYRSAVICNPSLAQGYFNLANAYHEMGYFAEAEEAVSRAMGLYKAQGRMDMVGQIEKQLFVDKR